VTTVLARGVSFRYGADVALHPLGIDLEAGDRLAVLGGNGAGKTTLLRMLATAARPSSGTLHLLGLEAVRDRTRLRARIGYCGHQPGLYGALSALENLRFYCILYGLPRSRAAEALELVGLAGTDRPASELSRGMQQRLAIARSVLHDPELWVLDEPDASLDNEGRLLLSRLAGGRTLVLATHDRELAAELCDRTLTLRDGRVVQPPKRLERVI
jgi:heme ABC exporter ATP-binding subunit CcmA